MSGELPWWSGIALSILQFLVLFRPWHLILAGLGGIALCLAATRASIAGIVAAVPFGAIALLGLAWEWRAHTAPRSFPIVVARTVDAPGGDDSVEWKFDPPHTIFRYSRRPDGELWIEAIEIAGTNLSERSLQNTTAKMTPFARSEKRGEAVRMHLIVDGRKLPFSEPQIIPARSDFALVYPVPQTDGTASGMPFGRFEEAFGDLHFIFRYDTGQMFSRLVTVAEMKDTLRRLVEKH